jgi:hypothetical protein
VVSGSWPGEIFFFAGRKDGWAESAKLADADGKPLKVESASAVAVADWDRDGDLDLVAGFISGPVVWFPNESKGGTLAFAAAAKLEAGGAPLEAHDGGPCVADWDGDGDGDLLVGRDDGSVSLFRAAYRDGAKTPELSAGETIAKADGRGEEGSMRAKPCVGDWNDDGKPDLFVGDFYSRPLPDPELSEEQAAKKAKLENQLGELTQKVNKIWNRIERDALRKMGLDPEGECPDERSDEWYELSDEMMEQDEEYQKISKEMDELNEELRPLRGGRAYAGQVWLYLRR